MLEVSKKRMVTTRKEHECYGCYGKIEQGNQSINVRGKEDEKHVNFHLHPECHIKAVKQNLFIEGFLKGSIANSATQNDFSVDDTVYPF